MGGALSLHAGLRFHPGIGGIFACSSFLNEGSSVYSTLAQRKAKAALAPPKLLMFHGNRDSLVPISWGKQTHGQLRALGVAAEFKELNNTMHELKAAELTEIQDWISTLLPDDAAKL